MKRTISLLLLSILCLCAWSQTNPNRLLVVDKAGSYQGFLVERIDSLIFRQIEGRVAADLDFKEYRTGATGDTIFLSIAMTPDCFSFQIDVIPSNVMGFLQDEARLANYVQNHGGQHYYQDFTDAMMTGFDYSFEPNAEYFIVTLGYDGYGIPCSTSQVNFKTPSPEIVGDPYVEATIDEVTSSSFTMTFKPNADVFSYSVCAFEAGTAQEQFNMWGAFMGFATIEQMVYAWGLQNSEDLTYTWTAMSPGTDYEVLIAIYDAQGNFAPLITVPVSTLKVGGEGIAEVTIVIGDMGGDAENGYYQNVIFTPNAECSLYHAMLITKAAYDDEWGEEGVKEYLMSDTNPYNPFDSYWDLYGEDNGYWNVDPATSYYAIAIGKNINNEWGPMVKVEFTTPDAPADAAAKPERISRRHIKATSSGVTRPAFLNPKAAPVKGIILK